MCKCALNCAYFCVLLYDFHNKIELVVSNWSCIDSLEDWLDSVHTAAGHLYSSDVTKLVKIRIHRMRILTFKIRQMQIRIVAFIL